MGSTELAVLAEALPLVQHQGLSSVGSTELAVLVEAMPLAQHQGLSSVGSTELAVLAEALPPPYERAKTIQACAMLLHTVRGAVSLYTVVL